VSTNKEGSTVMSTMIITEANLTADPELRFTRNGQPVATVRLAVSARRKNIAGEFEDTRPVFYDATVWGTVAENAAESLRKGDRVLVRGATYDEDWTDRDGQPRTKHVIQVDAIGASLRYATATLTRTTRRNQQSTDQSNEPAEVG
jgi:single-strand DNA-binding protein